MATENRSSELNVDENELENALDLTDPNSTTMLDLESFLRMRLGWPTGYSNDQQSQPVNMVKTPQPGDSNTFENGIDLTCNAESLLLGVHDKSQQYVPQSNPTFSGPPPPMPFLQPPTSISQGPPEIDLTVPPPLSMVYGETHALQSALDMSINTSALIPNCQSSESFTAASTLPHVEPMVVAHGMGDALVNNHLTLQDSMNQASPHLPNPPHLQQDMTNAQTHCQHEVANHEAHLQGAISNQHSHMQGEISNQSTHMQDDMANHAASLIISPQTKALLDLGRQTNPVQIIIPAGSTIIHPDGTVAVLNGNQIQNNSMTNTQNDISINDDTTLSHEKLTSKSGSNLESNQCTSLKVNQPESLDIPEKSSTSDTATQTIEDEDKSKDTNLVKQKQALAPIMCEWDNCNATFQDEDSDHQIQLLVNHLNAEHVTDEREIEYCCKWRNCVRKGKGFNARYKMLVHIRTHTLEKPHYCSLCSKSFGRLENLKIHSRIHTGEKPYPCTVDGCDKAYANTSDRFKHMLTHNTKRPYVCKAANCTKAYTDPSSLRKHVRKHHGKDALKGDQTVTRQIASAAGDHKQSNTIVEKKIKATVKLTVQSIKTTQSSPKITSSEGFNTIKVTCSNENQQSKASYASGQAKQLGNATRMIEIAPQVCSDLGAQVTVQTSAVQDLVSFGVGRSFLEAGSTTGTREAGALPIKYTNNSLQSTSHALSTTTTTTDVTNTLSKPVLTTKAKEIVNQGSNVEVETASFTDYTKSMSPSLSVGVSGLLSLPNVLIKKKPINHNQKDDVSKNLENETFQGTTSLNEDIQTNRSQRNILCPVDLVLNSEAQPTNRINPTPESSASSVGIVAPVSVSSMYNTFDSVIDIDNCISKTASDDNSSQKILPLLRPSTRHGEENSSLPTDLSLSPAKSYCRESRSLQDSMIMMSAFKATDLSLTPSKIKQPLNIGAQIKHETCKEGLPAPNLLIINTTGIDHHIVKPDMASQQADISRTDSIEDLSLTASRRRNSSGNQLLKEDESPACKKKKICLRENNQESPLDLSTSPVAQAHGSPAALPLGSPITQEHEGLLTQTRISPIPKELRKLGYGCSMVELPEPTGSPLASPVTKAESQTVELESETQSDHWNSFL